MPLTFDDDPRKQELQKLLHHWQSLTPEEQTRELKANAKRRHEETVFRVSDLARAFEVAPEKLQSFSVKGEGKVILADDLAKVRSAVYQLDPDKVLLGLTREECFRMYRLPKKYQGRIFEGITLWYDHYGELIVPLRDVLHGYYNFCASERGWQ